MDGDGKYDSLRVVQEALPAILSLPGNVPVFKYLRAAKLLDDDGELINPDSVDPKLRSRIEQRPKRLGVMPSQRRWVAKQLRTAPTLKELEEHLPDHDVLYCVPGLKEEEIDLDQLKVFLNEHRFLDNDYHYSQWVKVCLPVRLARARASPATEAETHPSDARRRSSATN